MSRLPALLVLSVLLPAIRSEYTANVCLLSFCECHPASHPSWTAVNCTVPQDQKLDIMEGDLPDSTTDLTITGAEAVMFGINSLSRLKDVRYIQISRVKVLLMRKFAGINLNVVSAFLEIDNCDVLRMEERTFSNIKGPLSVTISKCDFVSLDGITFSWLLTLKISDVRHLDLGPEAFMLDPTAANVGEHGPGMLIQLKNLTISEIPAQSFGSSAAGVTMDAVEIRAIRSGAFTANTYNIIMAVNCSFHLIEGEAFAQKSLINHFQLFGCEVNQLCTSAIQSAVANMNISHSKFKNVETGAINTTVATVAIQDSEFKTFMERGFELSSWNKFQMERNSFDELPPHAIVAPGANIHELLFTENEIETAKPESLAFIGQAHTSSADYVKYRNNYYGQPCHCNISTWLSSVLNMEVTDEQESNSFCTVDEFIARCFNVPEQNMVLKKFLVGVCGKESTIQCEAFHSKAQVGETEIKNPRFPHKKLDEGLSDRNKKVIGIVIVTCFGCVIIAMFISLIRWMKRKGYCVNVKNFLISSNSACGTLCDRLCVCGSNNSLDNARSISQLSVHEYSERHRLNEPRLQEIIQEAAATNIYVEQLHTDDKSTQTLPEELTKELLENLKEKLEDPENYVEAREMIEHLYELIKVEESCNTNSPVPRNIDENIYELPFQNTAPRLGRNKKQMVSVGTRTPSLEKLLPLSPYNRQTALAHEYFEPKDFAVHLYAEIANNDKGKMNLLGAMPDVIAEQAVPRGPYLRAVRDKMSSSSSSTASPKSLTSTFSSPQHSSTIKSTNSTSSNSSSKMKNRPLPLKPATFDPGEGTSFKHG